MVYVRMDESWGVSGLSHRRLNTALVVCTNTRVENHRMSAHDKLPDQGRMIASLARNARMPIAVVAAIYERECAELATTAKLAKFVQIFALRNVREILRAQSREPAPSQRNTAHVPMRQDSPAFAVA